MQFVAVNGKPGVYQYTTEDGFIGISLVNEGDRIDEWHPSQVKLIDVDEAAILAGHLLLM